MRFIVFHFHDRLPEFALVGLVGVHCRVKCVRVKTHKGHLVVVLDVRLVEIDHPGGERVDCLKVLWFFFFGEEWVLLAQNLL